MIKRDKGAERVPILINPTKTNTTIFLLPALSLDKERLYANDFINAYYSDDEHDVVYKNSLYLLFKPRDNEKFEDIVQYIEEKHKVLDVYDIEGGFAVIVVKFPTQYIKEFKSFKLGHYSKFSKGYINSFFPFKKVTQWDHQGKPSKEEYTLFYHIFNKTQWLKDWWMKRLGYEDMREFEQDEWWDIPQNKKEVLRFKE